MMYLNEKERLEEEVKKHVCNDLTDAGERLSFASRHFKRKVSNILQHRTHVKPESVRKQLVVIHFPKNTILNNRGQVL